ncbi:hypothetical protein [Scopulibacillus cellulosilyticus]|uniref:Multidrug ABC transporter ATPase n=1 Tax=Scopulibacillus cellulosilyticus TaxID=2665665 RepID=A0ABW2PSV3_9BACL
MSEEKKPENSSMARNFKEVKELGKEMEKMKTNSEIIDKGKQPDPVQHEEEK